MTEAACERCGGSGAVGPGPFTCPACDGWGGARSPGASPNFWRSLGEKWGGVVAEVGVGDGPVEGSYAVEVNVGGEVALLSAWEAREMARALMNAAASIELEPPVAGIRDPDELAELRERVERLEIVLRGIGLAAGEVFRPVQRNGVPADELIAAVRQHRAVLEGLARAALEAHAPVRSAGEEGVRARRAAASEIEAMFRGDTVRRACDD